jgi:hypothetical protein
MPVTATHQNASFPNAKLDIAIEIGCGEDHFIAKVDGRNATACGRHLKLGNQTEVLENQVFVLPTLLQLPTHAKQTRQVSWGPRRPHLPYTVLQYPSSAAFSPVLRSSWNAGCAGRQRTTSRTLQMICKRTVAIFGISSLHDCPQKLWTAA